MYCLSVFRRCLVYKHAKNICHFSDLSTKIHKQHFSKREFKIIECQRFSKFHSARKRKLNSNEESGSLKFNSRNVYATKFRYTVMGAMCAFSAYDCYNLYNKAILDHVRLTERGRYLNKEHTTAEVLDASKVLADQVKKVFDNLILPANDPKTVRVAGIVDKLSKKQNQCNFFRCLNDID